VIEWFLRSTDRDATWPQTGCCSDLASLAKRYPDGMAIFCLVVSGRELGDVHGPSHRVVAGVVRVQVVPRQLGELAVRQEHCPSADESVTRCESLEDTGHAGAIFMSDIHFE